MSSRRERVNARYQKHDVESKRERKVMSRDSRIVESKRDLSRDSFHNNNERKIRSRDFEKKQFQRKVLTPEDIEKKNFLVLTVASTAEIKAQIEKKSVDEKKQFIELLYFTSCKHGILDAVKYLHRTYNIDINNCADDKKYTGLHKSAFGGHFALVRYFLENKVELKVNLQGETPYDACRAALIKASSPNNRLFVGDRTVIIANLRKCIEIFEEYPCVLEIKLGYAKKEIIKEINTLSHENCHLVADKIKLILGDNAKLYEELMNFTVSKIINAIKDTSVDEKHGQNIKPLMSQLCYSLTSEQKINDNLANKVYSEIKILIDEKKLTAEHRHQMTNLVIFAGNLINDDVLDEDNYGNIMIHLGEYLQNDYVSMICDSMQLCTENLSDELYGKILKQIQQGLQGFAVTPYNIRVLQEFTESVDHELYEDFINFISSLAE